MNKIPFLSRILVSALVLAIYNTITIKLHLFWTSSWLDSPSHILGGYIVALILGATVSIFKFKSFKLNSRAYTFIFVLIVGILWEIFEVKYHLTFPKDVGYWSDTLSDIFCDLLGGGIAYYLYIKEFYGRK